jgi:hypothetical protein
MATGSPSGRRPEAESARSLAPVAGLAGAESVGLGAGLDDVGVEGDAVDDRDAEPRVGERLGPAIWLVAGDRDGGAFFPLSEDLEQQLGTAATLMLIGHYITGASLVCPVQASAATTSAPNGRPPHLGL